jgi:hypothetical protein
MAFQDEKPFITGTVLGAYEYGDVDWTAGSTLPAPPAFPNL